ncbi:sugar-binding transcriptional regulator [Acidisoma cladoniae]|jgi:DNA-binding transcriptional regulator LsrR (DeoR family)|uniref:sugar-binding transcriptional regulator n=1 Tax=Acidisoma cladoniae TaxID=3040935 RepID=UPI0025511797|nr:sugar-binding domain-containing protein [Acidisoma sp. PAMC 29798]
MSEADLVTEIAALYYLQHMTQEELSKRYNTSRSTISRLIKQAHDIGVVEINVRASPNVARDLEGEFCRRFGIARLFCAVDRPDPDMQRADVASLVANYLDKTLLDNSVVAVGMGRNVSAISSAFGTPTPRNVLFASAIGGSIHGGEIVNPDHIARRLAARFGGRSETLYAPAIVADKAQRAALLLNETVKQTLDRARQASFALIGVGDLTEDSNMIRMGWLTPHEVAKARATGTIGDMMGNDFIDIQGRPSSTIVQGRVIGLTIAELHPIQDVIVIASENTKSGIILAALRTGVINTLATSLSNARAVIDLDDSTSERR